MQTRILSCTIVLSPAPRGDSGCRGGLHECLDSLRTLQAGAQQRAASACGLLASPCTQTYDTVALSFKRLCMGPSRTCGKPPPDLRQLELATCKDAARQHPATSNQLSAAGSHLSGGGDAGVATGQACCPRPVTCQQRSGAPKGARSCIYKLEALQYQLEGVPWARCTATRRVVGRAVWGHSTCGWGAVPGVRSCGCLDRVERGVIFSWCNVIAHSGVCTGAAAGHHRRNRPPLHRARGDPRPLSALERCWHCFISRYLPL